MIRSVSLQHRLQQSPSWFITLYAGICSFAVYFSMYAFRKPFTVAAFDGIEFWGISYKIWLVTSQVIGYTLSKFYGIRFISAMNKRRRADTIIFLILLAWIALLLFAFVPAPYNILFLLLSGFPLGMVWGLVFSFLEGRRTTEIMGLVLTVSFIFSSGFMKSVGKMLLLDETLSEFWMPFMAGAFFIPAIVIFTWLLSHLPEPDDIDVRLRTERKPMSKKQRLELVASFLPGLTVIIFVYILLTVLRDFRDNFANELWTELGYGSEVSIFTNTELFISLFVLLAMSLIIMVKENIRAFMLNHYIIAGGFALMLVATALFTYIHISPVLWMILVGTGLYMGYVPFNCLYFERMIASYRIKGNVGFLMYLADSFGYLGSVAILLIRQFFSLKLSWLNFFIDTIFIISFIGILGTLFSAVYFRKKYSSNSTVEQPTYAI